MKRFLVCLLFLSLGVSLLGCGAPSEPPQTVPTASQEVSPPSEPTAAPTTAPTEEPVPTAPLFLKASSVTLSLVGETEDIYLGVAPREDVLWESDDPAIVSVEKGILTANGVGSTTVTATCGEQSVRCSVGCLARTKDELLALDPSILNAPKRLLPEIDMEAECTYFDDAAIVGDSNVYILYQHEGRTNYLGDIQFFRRGGITVNSLVQHYNNIYYGGWETDIEIILAESQVKRAYFFMGGNDVAGEVLKTKLFDNWNILLERIREKRPDIELVLMGISLDSGTDRIAAERNKLILAYNEDLRQFAKENGCMFYDLGYYVEDHTGKMAPCYSLGTYHMNEAGCVNWMKVMRYYAQYESEGGSLS